MNGPDVTTTGKTLKVSFLSDRKKQSSGAVCKLECISPMETTLPQQTEIPVTTTAAPTEPVPCVNCKTE